MTDVEVAMTAIACVVGAVVGISVPWWILVAAVVSMMLLRHPIVFGALLVALVSTLSSRAVADLADGPTGPVRGWVTLSTDPTQGTFGWSAIGRIDDHLVMVQAPARGALATVFGRSLAGEAILVRGRARRIESPTDWHRSRHLAGTIVVEQIEDSEPAGVIWGSANRVRRLLVAGAASLDEDDRHLFTGLVLGDDRGTKTRRAVWRIGGRLAGPAQPA